MIKLGGIAAGVILVGLVGYGAGLAAKGGGDAAAAPAKAVSPPKAEVQPSPRQSVSVASKVEGQATILKIVPDGSSVKAGDVLCELDSRLLQDQLVNQTIALKMAEAAFLNSKLAREVAEIAVREYREGDYVERRQDVEGNIKLAEAELALAELEFQAVKAQPTYGAVAVKRAELNLMRARFSLEKTQSRKKLLLEYTYEKTVKELESAVKKAHADELARQAIWELELSKEHKLKQQIANSTLIAPIDGRLRYQDSRGMTLAIGEGVAVRERQVVFSIEPLDQPAQPEEKDNSPATKR